MKKEYFKILQITDTHLFKQIDGTLLGLNTYNSFSAVLETMQLQDNDADLILLTGDLSQDRSSESYFHLAERLKTWSCPIYCLPGNHDKPPEEIQEIFKTSTIRSEKSTLQAGWQLIFLDSQLSNKVEGFLSESELARLEACLAAYPQYPALIALHHHPISMKTPWLEPLGLKNAESFLSIVDRYPNIGAVIWGHVHQAFESRRNHVHYYATPSTCIQFKSAVSHFMLDDALPGYRWIALYPNGQIQSGIRRAIHFQERPQQNTTGY